MKDKSGCYRWWKDLIDEQRFNIMMAYYPTAIKEDTDIDKFFGDLPLDTQLWIYEKEERKCLGSFYTNSST